MIEKASGIPEAFFILFNAYHHIYVPGQPHS